MSVMSLDSSLSHSCVMQSKHMIDFPSKCFKTELESLKMSDSLTIDDLKYHELRQIISYMSVRQLFVCRRVCHKWNEIITELLDSNPVLSLHYNDINHYTKEGFIS